MEFALLIAQFFTEQYLTLTPKDVQKMAMGNDTPNIKEMIQKHNAVCKLIQLLLLGLTFEQVKCL